MVIAFRAIDDRLLRVAIACILFVMMLLSALSCSKDKSSNPTGENVAAAAVGRAGGIVAITDHNGNRVTLTIPKDALTQKTTIKLEALKSTPTNPIATHLFTGVRITPDSLRLNEPAILSVRFGSGPPPATATLVCFKNPDLVYPLGDDTLYESVVEGCIYHFSEYGGSDPTSAEGLAQSEQGWNSIPPDPMDWWDVYENVDAMEKWADLLEDPWDMPEDAQDLRDKISDIVEQVASRFLNEPIPDPPCDDPVYMLALMKFQALVVEHVVGDVADQFDQRVNEIGSHCFYAGYIEYGHQFVFSYSNYNENISVTGNVEFHINPWITPSNAVYGGGTTHAAITGTANDCTITGSGENKVILSGTFNGEVLGSESAQIDFEEDWYTSSILTLICPDHDPSSGPIPPTHNSFNIDFPLQDGYVEEQPFIGQGGTGTYTWTLHITHQPE